MAKKLVPEKPTPLGPPEPGSARWMLDKLHSEGESCESDYDDGSDGWFGWRVTNPAKYGALDMHTLIVRWTPDAGSSSGTTVERRWRMLAVPEGTE